MIVVLHVHFHTAMLPFLILLVLLLHGQVLWTPPSSGTTMQEERKTETETESEIGIGIGIGTEKENAPGRERGSAITVPRQVFSTVTRSDTDTGSTRREAMSVTEQVGRRKSGTGRGGTGRRRRAGTSRRAVIVDVAMKVKKETVTGDTSTKSLKEAKKEKKPAVSPPPSRRVLTLHLRSRQLLPSVCTGTRNRYYKFHYFSG